MLTAQNGPGAILVALSDIDIEKMQSGSWRVQDMPLSNLQFIISHSDCIPTIEEMSRHGIDLKRIVLLTFTAAAISGLREKKSASLTQDVDGIGALTLTVFWRPTETECVREMHRLLERRPKTLPTGPD